MSAEEAAPIVPPPPADAEAEVTKEYIQPNINTDQSTWEGYLNSFLVWAASDPYTFLFYVLLVLSPCFLISAGLSYKLSKELERQEKEMKKRKRKKTPAEKQD